MNTTPPNVPNPNNDATPKKRSIVKTILFILWLILLSDGFILLRRGIKCSSHNLT